MSLSNTFRALVTRAKKTPAKVEMLKRAGKNDNYRDRDRSFRK